MQKMTIGNLNKIWKQLDNASGSLYNALDNLHDLGFTYESTAPKKVEIADLINRIDITKIDMLKNEIEEIIELRKHKKLNESLNNYIEEIKENLKR